MKPGMMKYLSHEAEYIAIVTVALVLLSVLVFPIFIAFLPLVLLVGMITVWRADHQKTKPKP
jgi:MFS superfamily sulfate permease-like transporter